MQDIIDTARQMADGNHPGVVGENAKAELDRVARFLGECQAFFKSYLEEGNDYPKRHTEWAIELLK